jgi:hypothetical protein
MPAICSDIQCRLGSRKGFLLVVYYESINRELKTRPIYECRCDERLKTKAEVSMIYTSHIHWVDRGTETPKDKDEVNRRDVCECDG